VSRLKFGWCLDGHHKDCPGTIKSANGPVMVCTCPHHEQVERYLEELI